MATGDLTRIRTNIAALNALTALKEINSTINMHQLRLSTGKRLNSAGDDPAGLTISRRLDARARSLSQALANVGESQNVLAVAEGGANNLQELLVQMRDKVVQAANDTLGTAERSAIQQQLVELQTEVDQIVNQTQWNSRVLLTGGTMTFQTGADGLDTTVFTVTGAFNSGALGLTLLSVATQALASGSLGTIDAALVSVSTLLQGIGAKIQRLTIKENTVSTLFTNTEAARSRIEDADIAQEQLQASKLLILQQTAIAMLTQANTQPSSILTLFR